MRRQEWKRRRKISVVQGGSSGGGNSVRLRDSAKAGPSTLPHRLAAGVSPQLAAQAAGSLEVPLTAAATMGERSGKGYQPEILSDISVGHRVGSWLHVRPSGRGEVAHISVGRIAILGDHCIPVTPGPSRAAPAPSSHPAWSVSNIWDQGQLHNFQGSVEKAGKSCHQKC